MGNSGEPFSRKSLPLNIVRERERERREREEEEKGGEGGRNIMDIRELSRNAY